MNIKELQKLKNYVDRIISKLTNEAIDEGVDTTSLEFETVIEKAKEGLISQKGISYEVYKDFEETLAESKEIGDSEVIYFPELAKRTKESIKKREEKLKEFRERLGKEIETGLTRIKDIIKTQDSKLAIQSATLQRFNNNLTEFDQFLKEIKEKSEEGLAKVDVNSKTNIEKLQTIQEVVRMRQEGFLKGYEKDKTIQTTDKGDIEEILGNIIIALEKLYEPNKKL